MRSRGATSSTSGVMPHEVASATDLGARRRPTGSPGAPCRRALRLGSPRVTAAARPSRRRAARARRGDRQPEHARAAPPGSTAARRGRARGTLATRDRAQRLDHRARRREPLVGVLGHRARHDRIERRAGGDRPARRQRRHLRAKVLLHHLRQGSALNGRLPLEQLERHHAERVAIRRGPRTIGAPLLGCHVARRAEPRALPGQHRGRSRHRPSTAASRARSRARRPSAARPRRASRCRA